MKLITIEEHYASPAIAEKIKKIVFEKTGKETTAVGDPVPGINSVGEDRISYMDENGIDVQILSCASLFPSAMEREDAIPLCREVNDEMAEAVQAHPGRYYAFATLPLSSPKDAAQELERCVKNGFVGVMLAAHYEDRPYDDPLYYPIFEKAQELDVPVYLHPCRIRQDVADAYYKGDWDDMTSFLFSGFGLGWHYEVGIQVVRMMLAGVFDKLPNLKTILGHWGEVVSFYMHRMDEMMVIGVKSEKKISEYFKNNIYVTPSGMLYGEQLRFCMDTLGADHILWSEDYPYRKLCDGNPYIKEGNIRSFLENFALSEEDKEKIAHGNAERLMRLQK